MPQTHTVAVGDSLRFIALKYYGPGGHEHWKLIYDANREKIGDNPYIIRPGQVLTIPDKPETLLPSEPREPVGTGT